MPSTLRSSEFWIGVAVGVVGPMVLMKLKAARAKSS